MYVWCGCGEWYVVCTYDDVLLSENGMYVGSRLGMLQSVFPEYNWRPVEFIQVPKGYWASLKNQRNLFDTIGIRNGVQHYEDWYMVGWHNIVNIHNSSDIRSSGNGGSAGSIRSGSSVLEYFGGSTVSAIQHIYPEYQWNSKKFHRWGKAQRSLTSMLSSLFPSNTALLCNYKHPALKSRISHRYLELDIFVPSLSLAIEYQGYHHYHDHALFGASVELYQRRDAEKKQLCEQQGITLVTIPYNWDKQWHTLLKYLPHHLARTKDISTSVARPQ